MQRGRDASLTLLMTLLALAGWSSQPAGAASLPVPGLPNWLQTTYGNTTQGSASIDANGVISVKGAGKDTWERDDEFEIVYEPLKGDGSITTKMLSAEEGHNARKLGIMMRNDLTDPAAAVMEFDMSGGGAESIFRNAAGQRMTEDQKCSKDSWRLFPDTFPVWLKVERRGDHFTPYASEDGVFWIPVTRAQPISMKDEIIAGLFVMSHEDDTLRTATYDGKATDVSNRLLKPEEAAPLQPDPVVAMGGNDSVLLVWDPVIHLGKEADGYIVYKKAEGETDFTKIAELPADKTSYVDEKIKNGEKAFYRVTTVVKVGAQGEKVLESTGFREDDSLVVVSGAPNPPLKIGDRQYNANILDGGPPDPYTATPGEASSDSSGVVTLKASGWDIEERSDGGEQLLTLVRGDFTFTARLLGIPTLTDGTDADENSKFGIAVRESTLAESRYAGMLVTPQHGIRAPHRRVFTSGFSENLGPNETAPQYPLYLRLQRRGDEIRMFTSADGTTYQEYGSPATTLLPGLAPSVYVGLIGSSHDNDQVAQARFDKIELMTP